MPLSYPYKQNEEDKEIPMLTFVDETMTPFAQLPPDDCEETDTAKKDDKVNNTDDDKSTATK